MKGISICDNMKQLNWEDIPNQLFTLKEVPNLHPSSSLRNDFWKKEKRKCIEGHWESGKYIPPKLYFYINYSTILLNESVTSKRKIYSRPKIRDIEWEFHLNLLEARGFSGFSLDDQFTCLRAFEDISSISKEDMEYYKTTYPSAFSYDGTPKTYERAYTYLRRLHNSNLGKPLYENEAKDLLWLASRGCGKSFLTANVVLHEWLFDGLTDYDEYLAYLSLQEEGRIDRNKPFSKVSVLVGAADAKYSKETLLKTKDSLEMLPGSNHYMINGEKKFVPSPFYKSYQGSWDSGNSITAIYKKKEGGTWIDAGSKSTIKNRSFKDNAFAGQGDRNSIILLEEIGMFSNARSSKAALEENMKHSGTYKFGTCMMVGTGGDMKNGTLDAYQMFYDPKTYNLLEFEDKWENRGKIAYFTPAYYGLNDLKDDNGNTYIDKATQRLLKKREELLNSKSGRDSLDNLIQYQPLIPSEVFLVKQGNVFPIFELKERLTKVQQTKSQQLLERKVTLRYDPESVQGVTYDIDVKNKLTPINTYPWPSDREKEGCIVVYELPETDENGKVPDDLYIIGHDPYRSDSITGESLAATIVMKTKKYFTKYGHDEVVAVYYGRPYEGRHVVNENLLKLSMFYNAKVSFENNVGNVKEFFEKHKALHRLLKTPQTVLTSKANQTGTDPSTQIIYGYPISNQKFKIEALSYVRDWLLEERGVYTQKVQVSYKDKIGNEKKYLKDVYLDDRGEEITDIESIQQNQKVIRNLDLITDEKLLLELISFNMDGNFDAVMALCACVLALEESHNKYIKQVIKENDQSWKFLTHNSKLFPSGHHNPDIFFNK